MINVCFHGIGVPGRPMEPGESAYWVSVDAFNGMLDRVVGRDDVRLSFDDGNESDVAHALPALVERGLFATFFVLAGRLNSAGSLSAQDVQTLRGAGMVIGTHGMDHVPWPEVDDAGLDTELVEARQIIADVTGTAVEHAACPLGRYDRRVLRRLRSAGYCTVGTSDRRPARAHAWLQPRYSVRSRDTPESFTEQVLIAPSRSRRVALEAWGAYKRLR